MSGRSFEELGALFSEARALDAEGRREFLDRRCGGDAELRARLESLLRHDETEGDHFLSAPPELRAGARALADDLEGGLVGRAVGPYRIRSLIARGGMGEVYLAAREGDFERLVALKVINRGAPPDEVIQRFELERQVHADLNHPYVARLLDGGRTEDGLPYLVMEHVEGLAIDRYCDERRLGIRERLELAAKVGEAVGHAHRNGVIHRDLKPANILVTPEGAPKLLDFGIAKLLAPRPGGPPPAALTRPDAHYMTLEYASPEQARRLPLTTATDVYSLGLVLYEMVCGRRPQRLDGMDRLEAERIIREVEPPAPSQAARRPPRGPDEPTPERIASLRAPDGRPATLSRLLRGDVDTIVLKALQKEPGRRYSSVDELVDDIRRHLEDRPVRARKDTLAYRARKLVRRHPLASLLGGLAAALLGALVAGGALYAVNVGRERDRARASFLLASDVNSSIADLADELKPIASARAATVARVLGLVGSNYDKLLVQEADSAPALANMARAQVAFSGLYVELGDSEGARRSAERAEGLYRRLIASDPSRDAWRSGLAAALVRRGVALSLQGRPTSALAAFREAFEIRSALLASEPDDLQRRSDLADSRYWLGALRYESGDIDAADREWSEALRVRRELAALGGSDPRALGDLAKSVEKRGDILYERDDLKAADEAYREALGLFRELNERDGLAAEWTRGAFRALMSLAAVENYRGRPDAARERVDGALELASAFARLDPSNAEWQRCLLQIRSIRADAPPGAGGAGGDPLRELLSLAEVRAARDPANAQWRLDLAGVRWRLGLELTGKAKRSGSAADFDAAASALDAALADLDAAPRDPLLHRRHSIEANARRGVAELLRARGDEAGARAAELEARRADIDYDRRRAEDEPDQPYWRERWASEAALLGHVLTRHGDIPAATAQFREALAVYEGLPASAADRPERLRDRAALCETLAGLLGADEADAAMDLGRRAVALRERIAATRPDDPGPLRELADAYGEHRTRCRSRGDQEGMREAHRKRLDALDRLDALAPDDPLDAESAPSSAAIDEATASLRRARLDLARRALDQSVALDKLAPGAETADEVAAACAALARLLASTGPTGSPELRSVLTLGRDRLRDLAEQGPLHPVHRRMLDRFQAALDRESAGP